MDNSKEGNRDHYVPRFYLRRWAEGEFLCSVTWISHKKMLSWKKKSTKSIGYEVGLYEQVEKSFFMPLDTKASKLVELFEKYDENIPKNHGLSEGESDLWARYILAQLIRVPENVRAICDNHEDIGINSDVAKEQLPKIICNSQAISDLRNMVWIFAVVSTENELITSDNPLIFKPNNLAHESCVIILPMGPRSFFLATHPSNLERLEKDPRKMVSYINQEILVNANENLFMQNRCSISETFIKQHWPKCT